MIVAVDALSLLLQILMDQVNERVGRLKTPRPLIPPCRAAPPI